jgi:protein phosphatase
MKLRYAVATDVGRVREHNEDSVLVVPEDRLFLLADGMGGHACGEVASQMAVQAIADAFRGAQPAPVPGGSPPERTLETRLRVAVEAANEAVFAAGQRSRGLRGMGTTVVAAAFDARGICVAHVGRKQTATPCSALSSNASFPT